MEAPTQNRRQTLSRSEVIATAVRLLEDRGVGELSMRALARELGVGHGSLYWQVRDKDELLRLILDETFGEIEIPAAGAWDERLIQLLRDARQALRPRPAVISILWNAGWELGPKTLRLADQFLALIAESGLPESEVPDAYWTALVFLLGFVLAETASRGTPAFARQPDGAAERYPSLVRYAPGTEPERMDERFEYGIDRVIASIRARATPER